MGFGDLKSSAGLKILNDFLADKSYIEGWVSWKELLRGSRPARLSLA